MGRLGMLWVVLTLGVWSVASTEETFREAATATEARLAFEEALVVKTAQGFLTLTFSEIAYVEEAGTLTEAVRISWTLLESEGVSRGEEVSTVTYSVKVSDDRRSLELVDGSQDFVKADVQVAWSYASPDAVWVYLEPETQYTVLRGP